MTAFGIIVAFFAGWGFCDFFAPLVGLALRRFRDLPPR
jgi:hypothetical protein